MKTLLQTEALTKCYGAIVVTDKVTLDVREGELHAIIGPNGAGKTTLINQLSGELLSDSGRIRLGDADITASGINDRARMGLVRSYQITSVFDEFTVLENATLAALGARTHAFRFWQTLLGDQEALAAAKEGIAAAGLETRTQVLAGKASTLACVTFPATLRPGVHNQLLPEVAAVPISPPGAKIVGSGAARPACSSATLPAL